MVSKPLSPRSLARALIVVAVVGCGGGPTTPIQEDPVATSMTVTPTAFTLTFVGQTFQVTARVLDQKGSPFATPVTYSTSDAAVATVAADGRGTAVGNGTATVTASAAGLSATAAVSVQQQAASIVLVSGGDQGAIADSTLADPVVVRVNDTGGTAVPGVTVTFTPDGADGSVSSTSAVSDANGEARTEWTLGSHFGPHRLVASRGLVQVEIFAYGFAATPTPDIALVEGLVARRPDPSSLETFSVGATLRNDGNLATGPFMVRFLSGGVELETQNVASLDQNAEVEVEVTVGPLAAGSHAFGIVVDPDDAVAELFEDNNEADRTVSVIEQTLLVTGSGKPVSATTGADLLFRVDIPPGSPSVLTVELSGGSGDADLFVHAGVRPPHKGRYEGCLSYTPTTNERCQIASPEGPYHIIVHGFSAFSGTTLTATLGDDIDPFDIDIVFIDHGTATQDQAFTRAAERWERILVGDLEDWDFTDTGDQVPAGCVASQPLINAVDDLRIYVTIDSIDGEFNILGSAGPCLVRAVSEYQYVGLPFVGQMRFDEADVARLESDGDLDEVILHEMGHVLGMGSLCQWVAVEQLPLGAPPCGDEERMLVNPSEGNPGAATHFNGPRSIAAFDAVGGTTFPGPKVPVENLSGPGSDDSHWRESIFETELMTPELDAGTLNQLSIVTIEQFADLGYQVDVTGADVYALPKPLAGAARVAGERRVIDLRGDVRRGAIWAVTMKGDVVGVYYR